jgi:hypothetical protein
MSQEEKSVSWEVIISVILSKKVYIYLYPIPNGFRDRVISLYSSLDLAPNIVLPSRMWIGVKRQLAVVTVVSDIVECCGKMPYIFANAEYADMLYAILTRVAKCIDVDRSFIIQTHIQLGARGSIVGWGTMLQARRSRVRVPMRWICFFQFT